MPRRITVTPFAKQCFVTAAVGFNLISHGCAVGFSTILLPQLRQRNSALQLTTGEESWIASLHALSMLIGNFIAGPIMDKAGRKAAHYALTVPSIVGWLMTISATNVKVMIITRIILGISSGIIGILCPVLIGEYTSPKNRGAFLTTISLTQAFGIFLVHLLGSFLSWQITSLICSFISFTSLLMIIYTPESPSWYAGKSRFEECRKVFRWLRGDEEEDELAEMIEAQIEMGHTNAKKSNNQDNCLQTAFKTVVKKEFYKPIILTVHANILMQFAGGTTMAAYSTEILSMIMGPTASVYFWTLFIDTQRIITNLIAVYVINKVKRRTIMFSNGSICVIVHLVIAAYVYGKTQGWMPVEGVWLPALLVNIQFFTVGMAMVPMPRIIAGEVFPLEYREVGGTISMVSMCVTIFLVLKTFPGLVEATSLQGTYLLYAIILTYNLCVIWVLLPETKGRTLQQIEDELRERTKLKSNDVEDQSVDEKALAMTEFKRNLSEGESL